MRSSTNLIKADESISNPQAWVPNDLALQIGSKTHRQPHEAHSGTPGLGRLEQLFETVPLGLPLPKTNSLVEMASGQAEDILSQASKQAAQIAYLAHRDGFDKGRAAAQEEAADLLRSVRGIVDEVQAWRMALLQQSEHAVIELTKDIARVVFGEGITLEPKVLTGAFERALAEARTLGDLRLHVNPEDMALVEPLWQKGQSEMTGQRIQLISDQAILRGGCLIEGQFGSLDAKVETQLQLALETVTALLPPEVGERS